MKAIVAVDKNWGIGRDGGLLCHLSADLKYFKEQTIGGTILIGRKTLESFPGGQPLPGRTHIVLTSDPNYKDAFAERISARQDVDIKKTDRMIQITADAQKQQIFFCEDTAKIPKTCDDAGIDTDDVFICGGGSVYEQMLPLCDEVLVTKIEDVFEADTAFPNLDESPDFSCVWESEMMEEAKNDGRVICFRFTRYERTR